ncbi:MAG: hypothetical protein ACRC1J_03515, partial [Sandaracinobacteroides sp.]
MTEVLHHPVEMGEGAVDDGPRLAIRVHSMSPVPDVAKMTGRHLADQQSSLAWVFQLQLRGQAEGLMAQARIVEAAASDIDARPVLSGAGWRADMVL